MRTRTILIILFTFIPSALLFTKLYVWFYLDNIEIKDKAKYFRELLYLESNTVSSIFILLLIVLSIYNLLLIQKKIQATEIKSKQILFSFIFAYNLALLLLRLFMSA